MIRTPPYTADTFACVDCRTLYPTQHEGGTGYAIARDAHFLCYDCAAARERRDIETAERYAGYLASDGRTVTTWTGHPLAVVTFTRTRSRAVYFRAATPDGAAWSGRTSGRGMLAHLRRLKTGTRTRTLGL